MKKYLNKKIYFLASTVFILQLFFLPLKSFATLTYQPLEPDAFSGFTATGSGQLGQFLSQAFQFGLALAAALAVIMIVWGGVEIMLSESAFKKGDGKQKIQDAIYGLLLALVSWLILYTINPNILNWDNIFPAGNSDSTSQTTGNSSSGNDIPEQMGSGGTDIFYPAQMSDVNGAQSPTFDAPNTANYNPEPGASSVDTSASQ